MSSLIERLFLISTVTILVSEALKLFERAFDMDTPTDQSNARPVLSALSLVIGRTFPGIDGGPVA